MRTLGIIAIVVLSLSIIVNLVIAGVYVIIGATQGELAAGLIVAAIFLVTTFVFVGIPLWAIVGLMRESIEVEIEYVERVEYPPMMDYLKHKLSFSS